MSHVPFFWGKVGVEWESGAGGSPLFTGSSFVNKCSENARLHQWLSPFVHISTPDQHSCSAAPHALHGLLPVCEHLLC